MGWNARSGGFSNLNYVALELNEGNVQTIFNRCLAKEASTSFLTSDLFPAGLGYLDVTKLHVFDFDEEAILKNRNNIKYLFGQLNCVKTEKEPLSIVDFFTNYLSTRWTDEMDTLLQLLYLGNCPKVGLIFPFNAKKNDTTHFAESIKPTLSPKDPAFPAWWDAHRAEWED